MLRHLSAVAVAAVLCAYTNAEDISLPKPAARIAGVSNPNTFHISNSRRLAGASHLAYKGEISPYLKKQLAKEAAARANQPRTVLSVFTRTASMAQPWFPPRTRKTPQQRLAELSEAAIPLHRRTPTLRSAHFF